MMTVSLSLPLSLYCYLGDRLQIDPKLSLYKEFEKTKIDPVSRRTPGLSCKQGSNYQSDLRMVAS